GQLWIKGQDTLEITLRGIEIALRQCGFTFSKHLFRILTGGNRSGGPGAIGALLRRAGRRERPTSRAHENYGDQDDPDSLQGLHSAVVSANIERRARPGVGSLLIARGS